MGPLFNGLTRAIRDKIAEGAYIVVVGAPGSKRPSEFDFSQVVYYSGLSEGLANTGSNPDPEVTALVLFMTSVLRNDRRTLTAYCEPLRPDMQCFTSPQSIAALQELFSELKLQRRTVTAQDEGRK